MIPSQEKENLMIGSNPVVETKANEKKSNSDTNNKEEQKIAQGDVKKIMIMDLENSGNDSMRLKYNKI